MTLIKILNSFLDLGFKQSFLERYCNLPSGKLTEILKGRCKSNPIIETQIISGLK